MLEAPDFAIIAGFMALTLAVGLVVSRRGTADSAGFFLGGRRLPWWLLGVTNAC